MQQIQAFRCSECDELYLIQSHCQQHCSQPRNACNQGRDPSQFAKVVPIQIRIDPRDRVVGGRLIAPSRGEGGAREDSPEVDPGQLQVELDNDDGLENDGTSEILRYPNRT